MNYFEAGLPWQEKTWQRVTDRFPDIPHALLLAGRKGVGKQQFAAQFIAWVLCERAGVAKYMNHADAGGLFEQHLLEVEPRACGHCESCRWLAAQTHPQFLKIAVDDDSKSDTIKVDAVRTILPFTQQSSQGFRVVYIEQAHKMNVSAANALLKTLEEPAQHVLIILTTDQPQRLLPTIRSRVQALPVSDVLPELAEHYVSACLPEQSAQETKQLLNLAGGAPLLVAELAQTPWYDMRDTWLKVWQALRAGKRQSIAASIYWQKHLSIQNAIRLQEVMCHDVLAVITGSDVMYLEDIDYGVLQPVPSAASMVHLLAVLQEFCIDLRQNVQPAILFDTLMLELRVIN